MKSDLKGLGDFLAWQTDEIPGPGYEFYTFWMQTNRLGNEKITALVKLSGGLTDNQIRNELENWCEEVYSHFWCEDHVPINYGYEKC